MHQNNNDYSNSSAAMNTLPDSNSNTTLHISYKETGYFSQTLVDYISGNEKLVPFYQYSPSLEGIKQAIKDRESVNYDRSLLVEQLKLQYKDLPVSENLQNNLELLAKPTTFTITTAHQPNIFTGPLYFIYKILHAVKLAGELKHSLPAYDFVPVYYMGSEDADLDELGTISVNGKKYSWQTKQQGAVGRMKVDKTFLKLLAELESQVAVLPFGEEVLQLFRNAYRENTTIQQATLELVNALFGVYGLVILVPDNAALKRLFVPVITKELKEQFSHKAVNETLAALQEHYKVQAGGREINLFYLTEGHRERIELENDKHEVKSLGLQFTLPDILKELEEHPERFSPNVILRGVFQETVLPNIAFIGGGGELAYWLELKKVFQAVNVPYPVLVVRNSFLLVEKEWRKQTEKLGLQLQDLFHTEHELMNRIVALHSDSKVKLNGELTKMEELYDGIMQQAATVDSTLHDHVAALKTKAVQRLQELEKKMLRAEKRKFDTERQRIHKIRAELFPGNSLQERVENISGFYGLFGKPLLDLLLHHSLTLEQKFAILEITQG